MNEDPLQEALSDESAFSGETDESELQALVSRLKTNILIIFHLFWAMGFLQH